MHTEVQGCTGEHETWVKVGSTTFRPAKKYKKRLVVVCLEVLILNVLDFLKLHAGNYIFTGI